MVRIGEFIDSHEALRDIMTSLKWIIDCVLRKDTAQKRIIIDIWDRLAIAVFIYRVGPLVR